eukprot:1141387-Pelagomonas_calceolata.AAC.8
MSLRGLKAPGVSRTGDGKHPENPPQEEQHQKAEANQSKLLIKQELTDTERKSSFFLMSVEAVSAGLSLSGQEKKTRVYKGLQWWPTARDSG